MSETKKTEQNKTVSQNDEMRFMKLKRRVRDKLNKCKELWKVKLCDKILNDTG